MAMFIERSIADSGVEATVKAFHKIWPEQQDKYDFDNDEFLALGKRLIEQDKVYVAIEVLKLNTLVYPESWRAWEGLGEAYYYSGLNFNDAVSSFSKSLELNHDAPENSISFLLLGGLRKSSQTETAEGDRYPPGENTGLQGRYLGQEPPGTEPVVFAPGIISTKGKFEYSLTMSRDGKEIFFSRGSDVMVCRWTDKGWTAPEDARIEGNELQGTPDGRMFLFVGRDDEPAIYTAERTREGWSEQTRLFPGMFATSTLSGSIYTTDVSSMTTRTNSIGIVRYSFENGEYSEMETLDKNVNSPFSDAHPWIAPDEGFILFDSIRPGGKGWGDFYVSFRAKDGSWSKAISLGETINTAGNNICPSVSPDGKYLFYTASNDIYWVSTEVIHKLRAQH
jgi:hypothetical protein